MPRLVQAPDDPAYQIPSEYQFHEVDKDWPKIGFFCSSHIYKKLDNDGESLVFKKVTQSQTEAQRRDDARELQIWKEGVTHDNIVELLRMPYNAGQFNECYYIFQYGGEPLRIRIDKAPNKQYYFDQVKEWTRQLFRAVLYLHSKPIIHGNLHPGNIIIDEHEKLRITNFGSSHLRDRNRHATHQYRAPEQILPLSQDCTKKADIWTVGTILYEMTTGKPLFDGNVFLRQLERCGTLGVYVDSIATQVREPDHIAELAKRPKRARQNFIELMPNMIDTGRGITRADFTDAEKASLKSFFSITIQLDPAKRESAQNCLDHGFLEFTPPY